VLVPVPHPDLEPLEEQVAEQIGEYKELMEATLEDAGSSPAQRAGAFGGMGNVYQTYGLTAAAEACYVNAINLEPGQARWPYFLGLLLKDEGRFDEAVAMFERSIALDPAYPPTYYRLAEAELARGNTDAAAKHLATYLEDEPESAAGWALKGEMALSARDYAAAAEHLEHALELLPRANRLHMPLALAYRELGEPDKAREHLAQRGSIGARPDDPRIDYLEELKQGERVHILRGRRAFQAGDLSAALKSFGQAVDANPESIPARVNLATTLAETGDARGAIAQLLKALELDSENGVAHYNLGALLRQQGDLQGARLHLEEAVGLDDGDAQAHLELGRVLEALEEHEAALKEFGMSMELRPSEEARLGETDALVALGRYAEAKAKLEEAIEVRPESGLIARDLALLLATTPDPELRDGARALELAQKVFNARQTVDHAELVALALAEIGRCEEAAQWQQQALESAQHFGAEGRAARLAEGLDRYQAGPPCRPPLDTATSAEATPAGESGNGEEAPEATETASPPPAS